MIIPTKLARNSVLLLCFPLVKTKNRNLHKAGGLITKSISVFCLEQTALYFKSMLFSIDFYTAFFLHAIPVCIIVSC